MESVLMGYCYECKEKVFDYSFSTKGFQFYKNILHTGDCYEAHKERIETARKKKDPQIKIKALEERVALLEHVLKMNGIPIPYDENPEQMRQEEIQRLRKLRKELEPVTKQLQIDIDKVAVKRYFDSKGAGDNA